mmetsp:Transcript_31519/g.58117  ORF Transcript_31519/g.58117 Transcript_31519/m.58117 type:complete len:109 (-) Transcript_31519:297-623(-)
MKLPLLALIGTLFVVLLVIAFSDDTSSNLRHGRELLQENEANESQEGIVTGEYGNLHQETAGDDEVGRKLNGSKKSKESKSKSKKSKKSKKDSGSKKGSKKSKKSGSK